MYSANYVTWILALLICMFIPNYTLPNFILCNIQLCTNQTFHTSFTGDLRDSSFVHIIHTHIHNAIIYCTHSCNMYTKKQSTINNHHYKVKEGVRNSVYINMCRLGWQKYCWVYIHTSIIMLVCVEVMFTHYDSSNGTSSTRKAPIYETLE